MYSTYGVVIFEHQLLPIYAICILAILQIRRRGIRIYIFHAPEGPFDPAESQKFTHVHGANLEPGLTQGWS